MKKPSKCRANISRRDQIALQALFFRKQKVSQITESEFDA